MSSKIHVIGNLTHDPEMQTTQGGTQVCNIRLATSSTRRNEDGSYPPIFYSARVFGRHAEACGKYLSKGSKIYVTGDLEPNDAADREGVVRTFLNINSANVEFLSTNNQQSGGQQQRKSTKTQNRQQNQVTQDDSGDDLPF